MTEQLNVQQMAEKLLAADNILILCHKNPDGDTVGCGSALQCRKYMIKLRQIWMRLLLIYRKNRC